ncbi:MAG TPA: hypothetical protein VK348_04625, partial [Planctomycetota bacterium]|nr:hypothetical protein [Planctomycetota bacterium]
MKGTAARIRLLASVFAVITGAVLLHLWFLMVEQHDTWLLRSYRNRWTFRDVPTHRGTISDRFGTVLAHDVPTFELSVNYERFRRLHPVGAAVHGANLLAEHDPDRAGVRFSYAPGPLGAEIACAELLGLPLARLRPGAGDAAFGRELRFYAASLLSGCSGRSRGRVVRELTQALAAGTALVVGQALPECSSEQLAAAFERCVHQLDAFDGALQSGQGRGHLLQRLDRLRAEWYELPPERRRARLVRIADRVPFDVAAALRTAEDDQPGLVLEPAVVRERAGIRPDGSVV